MASPNLSELVVTTLRNRSGKLADNVSNHNALLRRIDAAGNRKPAHGRTIIEELDYAENGTAGFYSGYDTLDTSAQDVMSAAEFDWKQLAGTVVMSGLEQIKNSGKERVIDLLEGRIKNLERTLMNTMATALYADGTGSSNKEIGGLQLLVADDPTASTSVGGINQNTYSFWRNKIYDFSVQGVTSSSTTIQAAMNSLYLACIRGNDAPSMAVADTVYFSYFWESLTAIQRIGDAREGEAGFRSLKYVGMDVFFDDQCLSNHMYMLNTDYMKLRFAPERNFVPLETRMSTNQDAMIIPVVWAGNLTVSNRARQGVIHE